MADIFKPIVDRRGTTLYPGFSNTVPAGFGRIQRLEKGSQRIQRGTIRPTAGNFTRLPLSNLVKTSGTSQSLSMTSSKMQKLGSVSPQTATNGFGYTSDGASITWYWDGTNGSKVIQIHRADQSVFNLPTVGSGLQVTGLANGTVYYFLPFWNTTSKSNLGWVKGTVGSPQIAFVAADVADPVNGPIYIIRQSSQNNEPLSAGFISATCGTGGSGTPDNGGCVMEGTLIAPVGDMDYQVERIPESEWMYLQVTDRRYLNCTLDHPLYHADRGRVEASQLTVGDKIITDTGEQEIVNTHFFTQKFQKNKVQMRVGHLFWANGFLSHNIKFRSP